MTGTQTSRRAILTGFVSATVTPLPAACLSKSEAQESAAYPPHQADWETSAYRIAEARYLASVKQLNGLPGDLEETDPMQHAHIEQGMLDAFRALYLVPIRNWDEFTDLFGIASDNGQFPIDEGLGAKLLEDAKRLVAGKKVVRS